MILYNRKCSLAEILTEKYFLRQRNTQERRCLYLRMWHEQRKEERRIRGMLVDRRRRAERRRDYYERIKADPNQFLQVSCEILPCAWCR